uniref:Putative secreted protein n=1 Tax=Ixodes ricinus TaxID=34613 RepID=A0A6B0U1T2_IXORI
MVRRRGTKTPHPPPRVLFKATHCAPLLLLAAALCAEANSPFPHGAPLCTRAKIECYMSFTLTSVFQYTAR